MRSADAGTVTTIENIKARVEAGAPNDFDWMAGYLKGASGKNWCPTVKMSTQTFSESGFRRTSEEY